MSKNEAKGGSPSEERPASIERATFHAIIDVWFEPTGEEVASRPNHRPAVAANVHRGLVWTGNGLVNTRSICGIEPKHIGDTLTVEVKRFG